MSCTGAAPGRRAARAPAAGWGGGNGCWGTGDDGENQRRGGPGGRGVSGDGGGRGQPALHAEVVQERTVHERPQRGEGATPLPPPHTSGGGDGSDAQRMGWGLLWTEVRWVNAQGLPWGRPATEHPGGRAGVQTPGHGKCFVSSGGGVRGTSMHRIIQPGPWMGPGRGLLSPTAGVT